MDDNSQTKSAGNTGSTPTPVTTTDSKQVVVDNASTAVQSPVKQYLDSTGKPFDISAVTLTKYSDLLDMIMATKSMDDKERQYWFHILPVMNDTQVEKLKTILLNEKIKLAEIDAKYGKQLEDAQKKQVEAWKADEMKQKMRNIRAKEAESTKYDANAADDLLKQLNEL